MSAAGIGKRAAFGAWLLLWLAAAAAVWIWAVPRQLERGCWLTEWPFEDGCSDMPSRDVPGNPPQVFLDHLKDNVGDGLAWARLARLLWEAEDPRAPDVLQAARRFAPFDRQVLGVQAQAAARAGDWPTLAQALVALVERGNADARKPLTALMLDPQTQPAVLAQLNAESQWLDSVLAGLDPQIRAVDMLPFLSAGSQLGIVKPANVLAMVERMKREGDWLDAYSLWVGLRGKVREGLFNPGFDQRALRRGFDWQWPQQAAGRLGMRVSQVSAAPQPGLMLEVEMTGRAALPQPMMSQTLLLLGDKYRFGGRYMSTRMRSEGGLVWAMRCAAGGERFAQTGPLKETDRKWTAFDLELKVPAECGGAVRLQLETAQEWEARAGITGVIFFDDFELLPVSAHASP